MSSTLKQQMIGAVKWSAIDRFGQQAIQFVIGIILARLLGPNEYGIIGMIMIFSAISFVLVEGGFGQALIRKQNTNDTDFSTIFYFNLFVSVTLYIVLFFSIPLIAQFFKEPLLVPVGHIIFLSIIFNAFYLVPLSQLTKEMNYKIIAKVNLISTTLSGGLGVLFAFMGYGVWSLVYQQVLFHFLRMIFYYLFKRWYPKWLFSFNVIRSFWSFSVHLLGTSLLNAIFNYIYILILGRFYVKKDVGYYTQANKLSEMFNFTFQTIIGSSYSLFAQIQDENERFKRIFRDVAQKISIVVFPALLVIVAAAKPLIYVLLSEKWLPSVPYFQLLCLAGLFVPLYTLNISALNSRGKSRITFKIEIIKKILILISILVFFKFGIIAMLFGYIIVSFIAFLISIYSLKKEIGHFIKHQIDDILFSFLIGFVIAIIIYLLSYLFKNDYLLLVSQVIVSALLYIIGVRLFFKELFVNVVNLLIEKLTKK
jgi:O-antigen/teichoic acid export membrane protein